MAILRIVSEDTAKGMYLVEMPRSIVDALRPGVRGPGGMVEADPSALAVFSEISKVTDFLRGLQITLDRLPSQIAERVEGIFSKLDSIDEDVTGIKTTLDKAKRAAQRKQLAAAAVDPDPETPQATDDDPPRPRFPR